jgi:stage II sporulation protein D
VVVDKNAAGRPEQFRIQTGKGGSVLIESEDFRRAINAAGDLKSSMRSCDCFIRIAGGNAEFSGRGFGHGVGLCQHGAQEMGRKGSTYQEILARYYPQSMIVKAWK